MTRTEPVPVALQLYTVRDETNREFDRALRQVADLGYRAVEFAGYGGLSISEVRVLLAETGLEAVATHTNLPALRDDLDSEIEYCLGIGCSYLVLAGLSPAERGDGDIGRLAPELEGIGARCRDRGIRFAYHNHDFEFVQIGGEYALDRLLVATDPALLELELDLYWAAYAGVDPAAYLRKYSGRVPLIHLKDMSPDGGFTEVGDGTLDMKALYALAGEVGVRWGIVEHDEPTLPSMESARRSLENLQAMQAGQRGAGQ